MKDPETDQTPIISYSSGELHWGPLVLLFIAFLVSAVFIVFINNPIESEKLKVDIPIQSINEDTTAIIKVYKDLVKTGFSESEAVQIIKGKGKK